MIAQEIPEEARPRATLDPGRPLRAGDPLGHSRLRDRGGRAGRLLEYELEGVVDDVLASGSIERARGMALDFMNEARRRLADCPSGFEHELLDELAASMVDRYS